MEDRTKVDRGDLPHAYAVLGLTPPVTERDLKRRYKELVARWHPDRFQSDPEGQAEAAIMLRNINIAYEAVTASLESPEKPEAPTPDYAGAAPWNLAPPSLGSGNDSTDRPFSLSQEQIDGIVESINRSNRLLPWPPQMTVGRWLSLAIAAAQVLIACIADPVQMLRKNHVVELLAYFLFPLLLIWVEGSNDSVNAIYRWVARVLGWLFLFAPAILNLVDFLMDR
jgi:hypothetical protein